MCTYNGEKYLKEQLDSLEWQTLKPLEVIIVDDASIDNTSSILESFNKFIIDSILYKKSSPGSASLTLVVKECIKRTIYCDI